MVTFKTLIEAHELHQLLQDDASGAGGEDGLVVLDCRAQLGAPEAGPAAWAAGHIPGAHHANLDVDLAAPAHSLPGGEGGRHPLPEPGNFANRCGAWGITSSTQVVAYDDAGGAYAARAWWMLRWIGHERVAVLNGGLQAWQASPERTLTTQASAAQPVCCVAGEPLTRTLSLADVQQLVGHTNPSEGGLTLIDARAEPRFAGEMEPIDPVAGHIPGALCFPHTANLGEDGLFLERNQLARRFRAVADAGDQLGCYCGSGVTAAHNVLAICHAGLDEPYLYVGSWSEWCADPARPIA